MLVIKNISKPGSKAKWHNYQVRINLTELFQFKHKRSDCLSKFLLTAAEAAKEYENERRTD